MTMQFFVSRPHLRLGVLLFAAFLFAGLSCAYFLISGSAGASKSEERSAAIELVTVFGRRLSGKQWTDARMSLDVAREIRHELDKMRSESSSVSRVFVVGRDHGARMMVADSSLNGPPEQYGVTYRNDTALLDKISMTGAAEASDIIDTTDFAPSLTAYAPIFDSNGRTAATLGLSYDAARFLSIDRRERQSAFFTIGLFAIMAIFFSATIVRHVLKSSPESMRLISQSFSIWSARTAIFEIVLVSFTVAILGAGLYGFYAQDHAQQDLVQSQALTDRLEHLRSKLENFMLDGVPSRGAVRSAASEASLLGLHSLDGREYGFDVYSRAFREISMTEEREKRRREQFQSAYDSRNQSLEIAFCIGAILALGTLLLVRAAAAQQQDLLEAQRETERHQTAYQAVAEHLPIGLYTYSGGEFRFTNPTLGEQFGLRDSDSVEDAVKNALHLDDQGAFFEGLRRSEQQKAPFFRRFRVNQAEGERTLETHAAPILGADGQVDYLLGFIIDVTKTVDAQKQLEEKNREVSFKNNLLEQAVLDLEANFKAMVVSLVRAVEAKDPYTAGHSERVMEYCVKLGQSMKLSEAQIRILERGALIHDIGKIGIPDEILTKPSGLTPEEFEIVKQHPQIGFRMIQDNPVFQDCIPVVLWHHERLDGSGYPDGLTATRIPTIVRIAAVADCFDAMTSTRAYRNGMPPEKAIEILRKDAEKGLLDGDIVEALAEIVNREGVLWQAPQDEAA